jgi:nitrogen regulatory protein PII-like uncharacterized protein
MVRSNPSAIHCVEHLVSKAFRPLQAAISCVTAAAILVAQVGQGHAAAPMTRADYEACQAGDEEGFRKAVEALTHRGLEKGLANVDYRALVSDEWRRSNMDDVIDRQVDEVIAEVRDESSWLQLWSSLASRERAQELAATAAERVYRSDAVKKAIEQLATGVGKEIGKRIELAVIDTAGPATQCMQAFLGRRYGSTVAGVVSADAGKEYAIDPGKGAAQVTPGRMLIEGSGGIAGTVVLVVRRQLSRIAARIGQRIVGAVLSRLVSVVAGGIGLVLIAKDIWDFRHGVLPIVAEEMKSRAAKDKVRDEIAKTIQEHIGDSLREIADKTAERVVEIWQDFRRAHGKVVDLADRNEAFRRLLDSIRPTDLPRLDEVVALVLASEGEAGVLRRLDDGTLNLAVTRLPPAAIDIARETRSLETALKWSAIAGDGLPMIVEYEVHRRTGPDSFTKAGLQRLIGLEDRLAVTRLAALEPAARESLLEIERAALVRLARGLDEAQLASLARYLSGLEQASARRVLSVVAQSPARMAELAAPRVREAIIASRDQASAVGMMLQVTSLPDPSVVMSHVRLVLDGRVSPLLLWEKDGMVLGAALLLALMLLLMLKRLLFGSRPRVVIQHVSPGRGGGR